MKINKTLEREDGSVTFDGELSGKELDLVIAIGLNYLLQIGAIAPTVIPEYIDHKDVN